MTSYAICLELLKTELTLNQPPSRCYSIVPAAGSSTRMGRPKLLLPWQGELLIDHVLRAWTASRVDAVVVVVRENDTALINACRAHPVQILHPPTDPLDMKESIQYGLAQIESLWQPNAIDRCFIAPADLPMLSSTLINRLIDSPSDSATIVVPQFGDKQGHPALLPWPITAQIFHLAQNQGVNRVVNQNRRLAVHLPAEQAVMDVDTPEEYQRLLDSLHS